MLPSLFISHSFVTLLSCLLTCVSSVGRGMGCTPLLPLLPPPQQVEGFLVLQNSMAFWEWDNASPPPIKPPKKTASASCLVCGGAACVVDPRFIRLKILPPTGIKMIYWNTVFLHNYILTFLSIGHCPVPQFKVQSESSPREINILQQMFFLWVVQLCRYLLWRCLPSC